MIIVAVTAYCAIVVSGMLLTWRYLRQPIWTCPDTFPAEWVEDAGSYA